MNELMIIDNNIEDIKQEYFYIRAKGESMNMEFTEGQLLMLKVTDEVKDGDIVLAYVDNKVVLRQIAKNDEMITLIPMSYNPKYIAKTYKLNQVNILGKLKQAIKEYN